RTEILAAWKRACAKKPATPNPAAKIAAVKRCSETEPSVTVGPMPGKGPPGSTSMSGLPRTTHSANTTKINIEAAPIAPVAAGAHEATKNEVARRIAKDILVRSDELAFT